MGKHSSLVSASEATVFIDTSLGTHLAVTVSHHDTVSALKRRIEYEHQSCFTSMGNFTVEALKVKRKGCFYHLSDSMLVKNAFSGVNKNWFLYADASDVPRKRLANFEDSIPLLLEGNERAKEKVTTADQNGSVDFARETSQMIIAQLQFVRQLIGQNMKYRRTTDYVVRDTEFPQHKNARKIAQGKKVMSNAMSFWKKLHLLKRKDNVRRNREKKKQCI